MCANIIIVAVWSQDHATTSFKRKFDKQTGYRTRSLLMVPITPHWSARRPGRNDSRPTPVTTGQLLLNRSEEVWSAVLGREGCAVRAAWPTPTAPIDAGVSAAGAYLFKVCG